MAGMGKSRIETSTEIEALLNSIMLMLRADTAILYKYIDESDVEGLEILNLISKSQMVKGKVEHFYDSVIDNTLFKEVGSLRQLVEDYKRGGLDLKDDKIKKALNVLTKNIKVLRFCDHSERDPSKTRWNYDYRRRPMKYLVLQKDILNKDYKNQEIENEGITGFFCRVLGDSKWMDGLVPEKNGKETEVDSGRVIQKKSTDMKRDKEVENPPYYMLSREDINDIKAHSRVIDDDSVFSNNESHHAAWILLRKEISKDADDIDKFNNSERTAQEETGNDVIGCIRLEYYTDLYSQHRTGDLSNELEEWLTRMADLLKKKVTKQLVELIITEIETVRAAQVQESYSILFHCLMPILNQLQLIGNQLKEDRHNLKEKLNVDENEDELDKDMLISKKEKLRKLNRKHAALSLLSDIDEKKKIFQDVFQDDYSSEFREFCFGEIERKLETNPLNEKLKEISDLESEIIGLQDLKILNDVHYLIEHLFYVFKRNTYFGEEAIVERLNRFIEDLLKVLELPDAIFSDVWKSLRRHEDLMLYNVKDYRDHFIHQFHVFVSGYMVIYSFGIERLRNVLNSYYGEFLAQDDDDNSEALRYFSKTDVMRIWVLTSLFHDCGYAFEKLPQGFDMFSQRVLQSKLESHFFWDSLLMGPTRIPEILERICYYYIKCEKQCMSYNYVSLFRQLIKSALISNDHGVISAIILIKHYQKHYLGHPEVRNIEPIMNIAAIAIALHNESVFGNICKEGDQYICLRLNPIAFILAYCDSAQEWGRRRTEPEEAKRMASPHLSRIELPNSGSRQDKKSAKDHFVYRFELNYPATEKGLSPVEMEIKRKLSDTLRSFSTSIGESFEIKYKMRSIKNSSFELKFALCGRCHADLKLRNRTASSEVATGKE